jgi:UDP-glucose:(heptosyl)LPS alpha-1,3-glucosyltransferase
MLEVLTPGVSRVVGVTSLKDQFTARSSLELPAQGRCVLFVANDYKKKGLPALLQALRLLSDETYLAVVGNASHIAAFKGIAEKCSVDTRVFFLGPQRNMDVAYRAADCLAHPTLEDTFAMVVLEGMSHGLPVVVSNARYCGISSLLVNKDQALILDDPQDPTELAELIQKTLSDKDIHLHLVQSGLKFALAYLWSEIATRQDNIYASVVSRKNGTKAN